MGETGRLLALYLAHRVELVNYAQSIIGDRARAEDLVQEAWIRLDSARSRGAFEEPVGYLYRIVRNLAIDGRRRLGREDRLLSGDQQDMAEAPADRPDPERQAADRDELRLLADAMAELPDRTRIALEMHRLGGFKLKEIAAHLGISVTTTHEIVTAGLAHCRRRVRPGK